MTEDQITKTADRVIAGTYQRYPLVLTRGRGCTLWDQEGRSYTDFVAGIAVCNLGHVHPSVVKAVIDQAQNLFHVSNLYYTVPQVELADWLVENSFADRVFFGNSGAEANEAAIKLARKYFQDKGQPDRYRIIAMQRSFHGRTMATLSATGQEKIQKGFDPLLKGFDFVPFNDVEALGSAIQPDTCAVMLEPVQGEGGVRLPSPGYLEAVRRICDRTGTLMIFDEIQTGMGRTGKLFAYEHFDVEPDIMTLAKALANGLPIGAMLAREAVAASFGPGAHASTFGGTPLVAAAALATVRALSTDRIVETSREMGDYFMGRLLGLKQDFDIVEDVRGLGLLLGLKLKIDGAPILKHCMENGFLINCIQNNILRFVPPLIIEKDQINGLITCLARYFGRGVT